MARASSTRRQSGANAAQRNTAFEVVATGVDVNGIRGDRHYLVTFKGDIDWLVSRAATAYQNNANARLTVALCVGPQSEIRCVYAVRMNARATLMFHAGKKSPKIGEVCKTAEQGTARKCLK